MYSKLNKFRFFLGAKVWYLLLTSVLTGTLWFLLDVTFVFIIQSFLVTLNIVEPEKTFIPAWMTSSPTNSILLVTGYGLFRAILMGCKQYFSSAISQEFVKQQRSNLILQVIRKNLRNSHANLINMYSDRVSLAGSFVTQLGSLLTIGITAIPFTLFGLYLAPFEFLIGTTLFLFLLVPIKFINSKLTSISETFSEHSRKAYELLNLIIRNKFLISIYGLGNEEFSKSKKILTEYLSVYQRFFFYSAAKTTYTAFTSILIISMLGFLGVFYFETPGMKILSLFYVFMRLGQIAVDANTFLSEMRSSYPAFLDVYVFNERGTINSFDVDMVRSGKTKSRRRIHSIELKDINFAYEDGRKVIENLNLFLEKGDVLVIRGESGSGKSTLVGLILGFLRPDSGKILIDGIDVERREDFTDQVGYVGPNPFLFEGTIKSNVLYGNQENSVPDNQIWNALSQASCDEVVRYVGGLDTQLSENTELSTGQRQRLAIARALLREPSLLILDEATANLDPETEQKILEELKNSLSHRISIIISHKDTFDNFATKKIIMLKSYLNKLEENHERKN